MPVSFSYPSSNINCVIRIDQFDDIYIADVDLAGIRITKLTINGSQIYQNRISYDGSQIISVSMGIDNLNSAYYIGMTVNTLSGPVCNILIILMVQVGKIYYVVTSLR